ncbi:glycosyltransferase [Candidatus Saccharibacteria bacterium]|nr:glycosyltransferase [Candidatus Saccharibacteria bacterium]MCL1962899.1 glycosyltransferase [Candidatus Saccharibacteria bacterium]
MRKTSIIVPVYADWDTLNKNIDSLIDNVGNRSDVLVYYVNDIGPEADLLEKNILDRIGSCKNFFYHRNKKNLGFLVNCNNAVFKIVPKDTDILLLNSDTKVTPGFLDEMREVLYSDRKISVVSPRGSNATNWSVPLDMRYAFKPEKSYSYYKKLKKFLPKMYICPTAHGFCMLIKRSIIDKYGLFDEIYNPGFAEENDFTMRIRQGGYKCATANYAFVFHYESKSFGNERRLKLIEEHREIILSRYPDIFELMEKYMSSLREPEISVARKIKKTLTYNKSCRFLKNMARGLRNKIARLIK